MTAQSGSTVVGLMSGLEFTVINFTPGYSTCVEKIHEIRYILKA